jgi:hypothetical protein
MRDHQGSISPKQKRVDHIIAAFARVQYGGSRYEPCAVKVKTARRRKKSLRTNVGSCPPRSDSQVRSPSTQQ